MNLTATEKRCRLRELLSGYACLLPANVYDPLSARVAEVVGFSIGLISGSVVSNTILAAPDLVTHTATEYADLVRRIMRASNLSLYADGDHGYGNALNVMRTVSEFEHAGVSALSIEDTALPLAFGQPTGKRRLISITEGVGKMRAALQGRADKALVIVARTSALKLEGIVGAVARMRAYAAAGVDAVFLSGGSGSISAVPERLAQIREIHDAARLPVIVGTNHGVGLTREQLAACGVRMLLQGHQPLEAALKALRDTYAHLYNGGSPAELASRIASARQMEQLLNGERYEQWLRDYMK